MQEYIEKRGLKPTDFVLCHGPSRMPYSTRQIRRIAKDVARKADFDDFHIHMLRHSVARWLLSKNYSINFVKRFLRHRNIKMTVDLYGNFDIEDMLRIVSTGEKPVLVLK